MKKRRLLFFRHGSRFERERIYLQIMHQERCASYLSIDAIYIWFIPIPQ